jgi:hypothetical protein
MKRTARLAAMMLSAAAAGTAVAQQRPYRTGPHNIELPADWQQRFIRCTTWNYANRSR